MASLRSSLAGWLERPYRILRRSAGRARARARAAARRLAARRLPPVSIVVATRNARESLARCLDALYACTGGSSVELIVVDDASDDGTPEFLADAQRRFATLHVILNDRAEGTNAAFAAGLARASGELVGFLESDVLVTGGWLMALAGHLRRDRALGMVSSGTACDMPSDGPAPAVAGRRARDREAIEVPALETSGALLRRTVLDTVGPPGDDYAERVHAAGFRIARARDASVRHATPPASTAGEGRRGPVVESAAAESAAGQGPPRRGRAGSRELDRLLAATRRAERVVVFPPSIGWAGTLFQRPQHLARALARLGCVVIYDCSNVPGDDLSLSEIEPRLFLYRGVPEALHALRKPIVWSFPYNFHVARAFPPGSRSVYDWIDDLSVFRVWDQRLVHDNHALGLAHATLVTAVARTLHEQALAERKDALYLPNAVDDAHFARPRARARDPKLARLGEGRKVAGYYGALARWLDDALLDETAARRPDWSFVLVGPMYEGGLRGARALRRPNVIWTGPKDYAELPAYAAWFDVALIPFRIDAITRATSPLKLYEYFAAGKPVVATAMPECMAFPEVRIVSGAAELSDALDAARADGRDAAFVAGLRRLGRENSWRARAASALARLGATSGATA